MIADTGRGESGDQEERETQEDKRTNVGSTPRHQPSLLERMSQAEPSTSLSARKKDSKGVGEEQDGVTVVSRQRKSKGRKKKRRPKDTPTEVGRHGRGGSSQPPDCDKEIREGEEEDEPTMRKSPPVAAPAAAALDHTEPSTSQATPPAAVTHIEGGGGGGAREITPVDVVRDTMDLNSADSKQLSEERPAESSPPPDQVVEVAETRKGEEKEEEEEVIRPRQGNSNSPVHEKVTAGWGEKDATNTSYDYKEEGEVEGVTFRPREDDLTNPFFEVEGRPLQKEEEEEGSVKNAGGNEEEEEVDEEDYSDLAVMGAAAVAARRGRGHRTQSDIVSSAVRSSTVDGDSPELLEIASVSHSPQVTGEERALSTA